MVVVWSLLVVTLGCSAAGGFEAGASPGGDGLPERVITDAGVRDARADGEPSDGDRPGDGGSGGDGGRDGDGGAADTGPDAPADGGVACDLLAVSCPAPQACYPAPFEGTPSGQRRCGSPGPGGPSVPCQTQLECDQTTVCSAPGEPDSICVQRCDLADPRCPPGTTCRTLPLYPGVGTCRL